MINDLYHKQHALYIHLYILKNQLTVTLIFDERDRFRKWRISINLLELLPRMQKPLLFFQDNWKNENYYGHSFWIGWILKTIDGFPIENKMKIRYFIICCYHIFT